MPQQYSGTRRINAPLPLVFEAISDVRTFQEINEDILDIEFLTEQQSGVGTRFRETRNMNGRKASSVLEITELVENEHVRFVSDEGGTIWDTVMRVEEKDGATELSMVMDAKPYKLLAKLFTPMIKGMIGKALAADMDKLKVRCEERAGGEG